MCLHSLCFSTNQGFTLLTLGLVCLVCLVINWVKMTPYWIFGSTTFQHFLRLLQYCWYTLLSEKRHNDSCQCKWLFYSYSQGSHSSQLVFDVWFPFQGKSYSVVQNNIFSLINQLSHLQSMLKQAKDFSSKPLSVRKHLTFVSIFTPWVHVQARWVGFNSKPLAGRKHLCMQFYITSKCSSKLSRLQ